jgi:hypothetical protein
LIELVLFWQRHEQGLCAIKKRKRPVKFLRFFPPLPVPWQAERGIQQELFLEILSNTFTVSALSLNTSKLVLLEEGFCISSRWNMCRLLSPLYVHKEDIILVTSNVTVTPVQ